MQNGARRMPSMARGSNHLTLDALLTAVRACNACQAHLPLGPRPVLRAAATARILIVGQAPGARVHHTGVPWDDPSGERLRSWMGVGKDDFYDESRIAIIPMGYCYPGRGNGGDLPPRAECAQLWLEKLLAKMPLIELTLLIGQHAQRHFLGKQRKASLVETTKGLGAVRASLHPAASSIAAQHALAAAQCRIRTGALARAAQTGR